MVHANLVLLVFAFVCFVLAALNVTGRINLIAVGLACLTAAWLVQRT